MKENICPDKPFRTYEELLEIMESRNVIISDRKKAISVLQSTSYYTLLNGYKDIYDVDENDNFEHPIQFDELYVIHQADMTINSILLKYILVIEGSLKSSISYIISKNYGVITDEKDDTNMNHNDYLYRDNYQSSYKRNNILFRIKGILNNRNHKHPSIEYYQKKHNHIPCWILINGCPFGLAIQWFQILSSSDKNYVVNSLLSSTSIDQKRKNEFIYSSLIIIKDYRNSIAHGKRVFSYFIDSNLPKKDVLDLTHEVVSRSDYNKGIGKKDIFAVLLIIILLTPKDMHQAFISELSSFVNLSKSITLSNGKSILDSFSIPIDVISRLEKIDKYL